MKNVTDGDWLQLKIMALNALIKIAENSPEPNRTIRLTDKEVWEFADSDSKLGGNVRLRDNFSEHGGGLFTAKDRIYYVLTVLKAHRVINNCGNGEFTYTIEDIREELRRTTAELLDYCDLTGVDEYGNLLPGFTVTLKPQFINEKLWLSREDLRFALSCSDLGEYRADSNFKTACLRNLIYGTPSDNNRLSGLDALDALVATDNSDEDAFAECNEFKGFFVSDFYDEPPLPFEEFEFQSQIAVVAAIKRCIEELGKTKGITVSEIAEHMTAESAVYLQEHVKDFSIIGELERMFGLGITSFDSNGEDLWVDRVDLFDEYADDLVKEWLESDLLVEGLMPDGSLNKDFFTMENVSSELPILISPYDFEELATAFVSHGNSLDDFCDGVIFFDEVAVDF